MSNKIKNIDEGWYLVKRTCEGEIIEVHIVNKLPYLRNSKVKYFLANLQPLEKFNFHESFFTKKKFKKYIKEKLLIGWELFNPNKIKIDFKNFIDK